MLRIIGGVLKGRKFETSKLRRTHPMGERVKGGLFNALGDIEDLTVLDAFAGSGALSFEAISRGSSAATAIELDPRVFKILQTNVHELGLDDQVKTIRANCSGWSDHNPDQQFDIVLCDPPYDNLQQALLQKLTRHVKKSGLYVLSWPGKAATPELSSLELAKVSDYGDAQLVFYRKTDKLK